MGYCLNASEDGGQVVKDFVVGEAENGEAAASENILTFAVSVELVVMDRAINLDNQLQRMTLEINDEASNDLLTAKLIAIEAIST